MDTFPAKWELAQADQAALGLIDDYLVCGSCKSMGYKEPFMFGVIKLEKVGPINNNKVEWLNKSDVCPQCKSDRNPVRATHA